MNNAILMDFFYALRKQINSYGFVIVLKTVSLLKH